MNEQMIATGPVTCSGETPPLWTPSAERIAGANLTGFIKAAEAASGVKFADYGALWRWSIASPAEFWRLVWAFCGVIGDPGKGVLEDAERMPGARFFPQAELNFAQNLLRRSDASDAVVFWGEDKVRRRLSWTELRAAVSRLQQALKAEGVKAGDRVAGIVPNMPEAIIAMLAAASLGAVWVSCSPDFGVQGVLDRFGQVEPKVLFAVDAYRYNGKQHDVLGKLAEIIAGLPSLSRVVVIPYEDASPPLAIPNAVALGDYIARHAPAKIEYTKLPFNHPLYIMFSSGTTGIPKCIVHGAGARFCNTSKSTSCTVTLNPAIASSISRPVRG